MAVNKKETINPVAPGFVARLYDPFFRSVLYIVVFIVAFVFSCAVSGFNFVALARKSMVVNTLGMVDSPWMVHVFILQLLLCFMSLCIVSARFVAAGTPLHYTLKESTDLSHHTAIVTGGTAGIGKEIALQLLKWGCKVIITGRDKTRGANAVEYLRKEASVGFDMIHYVQMDLNDLASVKYAAEKIMRTNASIDFLINNAGIAGEVYVNAYKREANFATNFLGHFYLTKLLMSTLIRDKARIINMSSVAHYLYDPRKDTILEKENTMSLPKGTTAQVYYGRSKLYNIWHAQALQRRFDRLQAEEKGVIALSCAPGIVRTPLLAQFASKTSKPFMFLFNLFTKRPIDGANTVLHLCSLPADELVPGAYYYECKLGYVSKHAQDIEKQEALYALAEKMTSV